MNVTSGIVSTKGTDTHCCSIPGSSGCTVEAVISVDERGQMVLPKEIRDRAGISAGDKLAVICWQKNGEVCCVSLMKVENLAGMVKQVLGPVLSEITR